VSLTPLAWVLEYSLSIVLSFAVNPFFAALGYLLEYYRRPELQWWGKELPSFRWNLIISVALGAAFLLRRTSLRQMKEVPNASLPWLIAFSAVMTLVTVTVAVNTGTSAAWAIQWVKMAVIFPLLVVGVVRTPLMFDVFIAAHLLGGLDWGWNAWVDPTRVHGRLLNIGSADSLNDNEASAHLLTILPFAILYVLAEKRWWLRAIALAALPFVVNTLILCNSRGAMVGVAGAMAAGFYLVGRGRRVRMITAGIATLAVGLYLADDTFLERQKTTTDPQDNSAQERLITWQGGARLVMARPLGAGGRGFHLLSPQYIPSVVEAHGGDPRAPHNTYVMVASEWGIAGLVCYLGLYGSALLTTRRIKKRCTTPEDRYYYWRAMALQLALVAYMICSVFADRLYGEAGYWMIGLAYALYRIQVTEQAARSEAPSAAAAVVAQMPRINYPLPSTRAV
jgi:putative inorganic carbon (hco3(-)) transporter